MENIAEKIFLANLGIMKEVLDLGQYGLGKDSNSFKYFKRKTMDSFYSELKKLFSSLESEGILTRCECKSNLRHGYSNCQKCHGAGYYNCT